MVKISRTAIKRLVSNSSGVKLTDRAVESISVMLEKKAKKIASYAVAQAKKKGRNTILKEDVDMYRLRFGD